MNITCLHRIIVIPLLSSFISTKDVSNLDVAITNSKWRVWFLGLLEDEYFDTEGFEKNCTTSYATWLIKRCIRVRTVAIRHLMNPRMDPSVLHTFDRLHRLNIFMNAVTESILTKCLKTLKTLKLVGNCGNQSRLLQDIIHCTTLVFLDIGHFTFSSNDQSTVLIPEEKMKLLHFSCSSFNISEEFFETLFVQSPLLTTVNLNGCTQFTDNLLYILCNSCPSIISLSLGKSAVTDAGVVAMTELLFGITILDLNRCTTLTSVAIFAIEKAYRHQLACLNISFCALVDNDALTAIHENCRKLKTLNITGCRGLSNNRILQVLNASSAQVQV